MICLGSMSLQPADPRLNAVVQASAGSGKTYLLTTRILRLLLAGAAPGSILAITFTRKAAAEIQARVNDRLWQLACLEGEALRNALNQLGIEHPDETLLQRAPHLYEDLQRQPQPLRATTFHAFCQELLRRFPLEADVPPGFTLSEETGALLAEAWDALMDEATRAPDGPTARALSELMNLCNGLANTRKALSGLIQRRSDWWAYRGEDDDAQAVGRLLHELTAELEIDPEDERAPAGDLMTPEIDQALDRYGHLLGQHATKTQLAQLQHLAQARRSQVNPQERETALRAALLTQSGTPRKPPASKALEKAIGTNGVAELAHLHAQLCQKLEAISERRRRRETYRRHRAWLTAGLALLAHYQRLKDERRLLDFDDLEWRAYRLLNGEDDNALWVQYKLDQRIDHILVDEFQDTNPTQWRLLRPLLEEMAAGERQGRSVFLVGDIKQSIYAFRRAQPALMDAAATWLKAHLGARDFPLDRSWRSSPAIIEAVNRVFEHHPDAGHMHFAPHGTHRQTLYGRVECLELIDTDPEPSPRPYEGLRNPLEHPRPPGALPRALLEGRRIAQRLRELLDTPLNIGQPGQARPLRPGDIMILLRRRTHAHHIERALREAGIPYLGTRRGTLLHCREVEDLIDLLHWLHTPIDDLALAAVLRSPLFAASDDDLQDLAEHPGEHWWQRLQELGPRRPAHSPLHRAAKLLSQWREAVGHLPVHDLLDRIYHQGDVAQRFESAFPAHLRPRVRANLQRLLDLALTVDSGRYPSIGRFLERIRYWREQANDDEAPDEGADSPDDHEGHVRLLTIHAAKGLEAPVVVLADSASPPQDDDHYDTLVDWPPEAPGPERLRLIPTSRHQDQPGRRLLEQIHRQRRQEDANLLYVAMTRARQILLVSGHRPRRHKKDTPTWYDLIAQALGEDQILEHGTPPKAPHQAPPPAEPPPLPEHLLRPSETTAPPVESTPASGDGLEGDDPDALRRGSAIHLLLEHYPHEDEARLLTRLAAATRRPQDDPELHEWLEEVHRLYQIPELAPYLTPPPEYQIHDEAPIQYRGPDGRRIQGIIDRLLVGPREIIILDYKTHREACRDNLAELAAPYREQIGHYCAAARRLWPQHRIRGLLLFTRPGLIYPLEP